MTEKSWKRTERAIAAALSGRRAPINGARGPDVDHPRLAVECKHRKALPQWLKDAIRQAVAAAEGGKFPIVILHEAGSRHTNDLVVLPLGDFLALMRQSPAVVEGE